MFSAKIRTSFSKISLKQLTLETQYRQAYSIVTKYSYSASDGDKFATVCHCQNIKIVAVILHSKEED